MKSAGRRPRSIHEPRGLKFDSARSQPFVGHRTGRVILQRSTIFFEFHVDFAKRQSIHRQSGSKENRMTKRIESNGKPYINYALWFIQVVLAILFLFAGGMKLITPIEEMTRQMPIRLPGLFLRFIGTAEVLGAMGLCLPGVFCVREPLIPLAAWGLVIIMIGATVYTFAGGGGPTALIPFAVGCWRHWSLVAAHSDGATRAFSPGGNR
jgi:hypothetical protein